MIGGIGLVMNRYLIEDDFEKLLREQCAPVLKPGAQVLNIACEFKRVPPFLEGMVNPQDVAGLEIDQTIVAKDPFIKYGDVDKDRFPFADGTFALALSVFGVEHFQTMNIFKEARRTLAPGGRFVFLVPNRLYPAFLVNRLLGEKFARFYYKRIMKSDYRPHTAYYLFNTLGSIRRAANEAGFRETSLTFFGPSNILEYARQSRVAQGAFRLFERLLTNRLLFRFKPYILAVLEA
jgi:SAM-dependent methyltransferase